MFNKKKKNNKGFTLVELLVVIAIIGILAVVAVPSLFKNVEKSKVADLEADISAIKSASMAIYTDTGSYPAASTNIEGVKTALGNEIESLSNPFKGDYALSGVVPNNLVLTITPKTGETFSDNVLKKIATDLDLTYTAGSITGSNGTAAAGSITFNLITSN